jgi:uncharacterized protein (TIGR00297 family)
MVLLTVSNEIFFLIILIIFGAWAGWKKRLLSLSGAIAAIITGLTISYSFGWEGLFILIVFFVSSSSWSTFKKREKQSIEERLAKNSVRDWQQVLANGGAGILFSFFYILTNDSVWFLAYGASVAAVNSDTWASEIGPLSRLMPISMKTFRRVSRGTSGAISLLGTLAAIMGALFVSMFFLFVSGSVNTYLVLLIALSGFLGNVVDTLIGAFFQLEYECKQCYLKTEAPKHCGIPAKKIKGYKIVNNEFVNLSASLFAGFFLWGIYTLL